MCSSPKAPIQNTVAPPPPLEAPKALAIQRDRRAANNMAQLRIGSKTKPGPASSSTGVAGALQR